MVLGVKRLLKYYCFAESRKESSKMNKTIYSIFKMSASNILTLISGVLSGFLIPRVMGLEDYALYKTYTLYSGYLTLLTLGVGDGLNLRFAGCEKEDLDKPLMAYYLHMYFFQLGIMFTISVVFALFFLPRDYRFIGIALSATLIFGNIVSLCQNLSLITSRFDEYSIRTIIKSCCTSVFVIILFALNILCNIEMNYKLCIVGTVVIEAVLAIWYVWTYRDIGFIKGKRLSSGGAFSYSHLIALGFPLLLSNMAGTLFLSLDRQFVSILFDKKDYAVYAFAYNMLSLITVMTSAVSLVLFPSMKKMKEIDVKLSLERFCVFFLIAVSMCLLVYFPLCLVVKRFLKKYVLSLEILRIVLPGILFSSLISVILINFYKLENQVGRYFFLTAISIVVSAILNLVAYKLTKSYFAISWASIISLILWYIFIIGYFVRKHRIRCVKFSIYALVIMICFYLITGTGINIVFQWVLYLFCSLAFSFMLYKKEIGVMLTSWRK